MKRKAIILSVAMSLLISLLAATYSSAASISPRKLLVVLVEFEGTQIKYSDSEWNSRIFGTTGNSVNKYFREISNNRFYYEPAYENYGTANDGVIKVTLPYVHSNNCTSVPRDAAVAADEFIDFSLFDYDKNGIIYTRELTTIFIFAGYDAAASDEKQIPRIFPASTGFEDNEKLILDEVNILNNSHNKYAYAGEKSDNTMTRIGILVHEFGHTTGLPDLYEQEIRGPIMHGPGIYSLMSTGCWGTINGGFAYDSPTHLDPFYKIKLEFCEPTVINSSGTYSLHNTTSADYNILKIPTSNPKEYFLIENRQLAGYDAGLSMQCANGGILVWHIDESKTDNKDLSRKMTDIEEANEGDLGYSQLDTKPEGPYDHFFYVGGHTVFNSTTTPNSNLNDGTTSGFKLEVLSTPGNIMDVRIDYCSIPQNLKATLSGNTVSLDWDTSEGAVSYELEIDGVVTSVSSNTFTYALENGSNGLHRYRVRAITDSTVSLWSRTVAIRHFVVGDLDQNNVANSIDMA
jgi:M6 family metalloprotease-like protein